MSIEVEIPDDPEQRHGPSIVGVLSLLAVVLFVTLLLLAWTERYLLTGGFVLLAASLFVWRL